MRSRKCCAICAPRPGTIWRITNAPPSCAGSRAGCRSIRSRTIPPYLEFLRTHPAKRARLLQDLLIGVTHFFRDRESFAALEANVPQLFAGKKQDDQVRVWVAGCATGEEAYSIAMLLCEHAARLESPPAIQIFATDIDEQAIHDARDGLYPATIEADVSQERLRRFFDRDHGRYRVKKEMREKVLFASHNLLKDAPFSRLDLVSCRNLLIYLNAHSAGAGLRYFPFRAPPGRPAFHRRLGNGGRRAASSSRRSISSIGSTCAAPLALRPGEFRTCP